MNLYSAIKRAKTSLWLSCTKVDESLVALLEKKHSQGLDIRLLTRVKNNDFLAQDDYRSLLHQKILWFCFSLFAVIGSITMVINTQRFGIAAMLILFSFGGVFLTWSRKITPSYSLPVRIMDRRTHALYYIIDGKGYVGSYQMTEGSLEGRGSISEAKTAKQEFLKLWKSAENSRQ